MEIIIFSNGCPRCEVLKTKMDNANLNYKTSTDFQEIIDRGFETLPVLKVNNEYLDFIGAVKWIVNGG